MITQRALQVAALVACSLFAGGSATPADAQAYPSKPIRTIVPFPAGTGMDILARQLSEGIKARTGQVLVVESRVGAGATVAMGVLARAKPDGYTIAVSPGVSASIYTVKEIPYEPVKDFERVATLVKVPYFLLINPEKTPVSSVKELTALLKAKNGKVTFGSPNTPSLVAAKLFAKNAGIDAQPVAYKSMMDAMRDLQGGDYDFMFSDTGFALGAMKTGKVKALGVTLANRLASAPDVPTMGEAGVAGIDFYGWIGVYLPAGGPPELTEQLSKLVNDVAASPEMQKFYVDNGYQPFATGPKAFTEFEAEIFKLWADLAKLAGIQPQ